MVDGGSVIHRTKGIDDIFEELPPKNFGGMFERLCCFTSPVLRSLGHLQGSQEPI